jgi:TfoX/Sxy family transcriptional regulator of competence genes
MDVSTDPLMLAARVEDALPAGLATQKRMFGGITFLVNGNMLCCASRAGLMVRVGAAAESEALASPFARPCLGAGRRMPGFIMVQPAGIATAADLKAWLANARSYVEALPAKKPAPRKESKKRKT